MRQAPGAISIGGDPSQQNMGCGPARQAPHGSSADPGGEAGLEVAKWPLQASVLSPTARIAGSEQPPAGPGGCRTGRVCQEVPLPCVESQVSGNNTLIRAFHSPRGLYPGPVSCSGSPSRQGKAQTRKQVALGPFIHTRTSSRGYRPSPQICRGLQSAHWPLAWPSSQDRQWGLPPPQAHCSRADEGTVAHSQHTGGFIVPAEKTEPGPTLLTLGCGDAPRPPHCSPQRGSVGVRWAVPSAWVDGGTAPPPVAHTSPPSR